MAGVTSTRLARPSCITTAATSAFWVASQAWSKKIDEKEYTQRIKKQMCHLCLRQMHFNMPWFWNLTFFGQLKFCPEESKWKLIQIHQN